MTRALTAEKKAMILVDYLNGLKVESIALEHNVSVSTAANLAKRAGLPRRQPKHRIYVHRGRGGRFIKPAKIKRDWMIV